MTGKIVKKRDFGGLDLEKQIAMDEKIEIGMPQGGGSVIRKDVHRALTDARKIIEEARLEAGRIKKDAESILRKVGEEMERAKKEGFEAGKDEGLKEVTELLVSANHSKEKMFEGVERDLVKLAYDIAEKIIGRDLSERESAVVDLVKQALHAAMGEKIVVLVNPNDVDVIKKNQASLMQVLDTSKTIQIRADEKVHPKGCLIETEIGTIDAQLDTQLEAIRKALGIEGVG